jgi:hypothetical protein
MKWLQAIAAGHANGDPAAADAGQGGVAELYRNMNQLPPQTQMFMQGCAPQLQAKFERIQARDLVMRNVLALSAGVQKTLYWSLHVDTPNRDDVMNLMYGKTAVVGYEGGELKKRYPIADVYQRMAKSAGGRRNSYSTRCSRPSGDPLIRDEPARQESALRCLGET